MNAQRRGEAGRQAKAPFVAMRATALWRPDSPRETDVLARVFELLRSAGPTQGGPSRRHRR